MKINKDTINFFKSLYWDYQVSEENIITIIESGECNGLTRKNMLSRALKSRRWYEIKKILSPDLLKEALSEDVLKTLFPKSLSRQYYYVKKLLYHNEEYPLKIEFVNDVLFHTGEIQSANFFHRIDSWENILSNKICALSRDEAKDVADLIFLSMKYNFTCETMINYAREKDTWVNEIEVSQSVFKFDTRRLIKLHWIKEPDYENMQDVCNIIAKDIIDGGKNSLTQ